MTERKIFDKLEKLKANLILKNKEQGDWKPNAWNKCSGDITSGLLSYYLKKSISKNKYRYGVSSLNSFIEGFPYEFDFLILRKNAKPYRYTSIYKLEDVICCMEFKTLGTIKDSDELKKYADKFKNMLKQINLANTTNRKVKIIYLTMTAFEGYFKETKQAFKPIKCFKLWERKQNKICKGAWKKLMMELNKYSPPKKILPQRQKHNSSLLHSRTAMDNHPNGKNRRML